MGDGWLRPRPGRFTSGKRQPLNKRLCGPQCHSRRVRNIPSPLGFDRRIIQPAASSYFCYAVRSTLFTAQNVNHILWASHGRCVFSRITSTFRSANALGLLGMYRKSCYMFRLKHGGYSLLAKTCSCFCKVNKQLCLDLICSTFKKT